MRPNEQLVRAAGVEPARASRPYGFSYHFGFRRRPQRRSWSGLSLRPASVRFRRRPSSLYTFPGRPSQGLARDRHFTGFPEFERFYVRGFPQRTQGRSPSPLRLPISRRPRSPPGLPQAWGNRLPVDQAFAGAREADRAVGTERSGFCCVSAQHKTSLDGPVPLGSSKRPARDRSMFS